MMPFVTSIGALTSVGPDVPMTMSSVLTRVQMFDDLDVEGASGDPVSGAPTALDGGLVGLERCSAMAALALDECLSSAGATWAGESTPLFLSVPHDADVGSATEGILDSLFRTHGDRLDRRRARLFKGGRRASLGALAQAVAAVREGHTESCIVGGVDTLLEPVRLRQLLDDGRLLDGPGADGFTPGEGAVFLRLSSAPGARPLALLAAVAHGDDPDHEGETSPTGRGLTEVARAVLRDARLPAEGLGAVLHDAAGSQQASQEIALAVGRLPFAAPAAPQTFMPAFSVGETGAAAAFLALAVGAFFLSENVIAGPALALLTSETALRSAALLIPSPSKERRHG